jgi:hypothetical protein
LKKKGRGGYKMNEKEEIERTREFEDKVCNPLFAITLLVHGSAVEDKVGDEVEKIVDFLVEGGYIPMRLRRFGENSESEESTKEQ